MVKKKVGWVIVSDSCFVQCVLYLSHGHSCFVTSSSFQDDSASGSDEEEEEDQGISSEDEDNPLNVKV